MIGKIIKLHPLILSLSSAIQYHSIYLVILKESQSFIVIMEKVEQVQLSAASFYICKYLKITSKS